MWRGVVLLFGEDWIDFHSLVRDNGIWKITNKTATHSSRLEPRGQARASLSPAQVTFPKSLPSDGVSTLGLHIITRLSQEPFLTCDCVNKPGARVRISPQSTMSHKSRAR
jgi:hypothetical protein